MSNYSKKIYEPSNPCKPQLYKTVKYRYYRYPTKYICTPVEWGTKCKKHVSWEPEKPYPPVKVGCEQLKQPYYSEEKQYYSAPEYEYAQENADYESDNYAEDYKYSKENSGSATPDCSSN